MANYLDQMMIADDPIVSGYMFYTMKLDLLLKDGEESVLQDLSHFTYTTVNIFAVTENFKEISNDEFYIPTEVNGEPGISTFTGEKLDAHKALYEFEPSKAPATEHDPMGIHYSLEEPNEYHTEIETIPILIADGLRSVLSIDTTDKNTVVIGHGDNVIEAEVIGLMAKSGLSAFTSRKVVEDASVWGKSVHTTSHHY